MAFQIKDFISIIAGMVNYSKATQDEFTDFRVGSVARTLMEAPGIEIEELYQRILAGLIDAIPTAIYKGFGFAQKDAIAAVGMLTVKFGIPLDVAITVPAGTVFQAPSTTLKYLSTSTVVVPVGATSCIVNVKCTDVGTLGNTPADSITAVVGYSFPSNSVISHPAFTSGRAAESEEERMSRFADYINSISRGTLDSCVFAAAMAQVFSPDGSVVEYVTSVGTKEGAGHVDIFIYGSSGIASNDLIAVAQKTIDGYWKSDGTAVPGYSPAGCAVRVLKMTERFIDLSLSVGLFPGITATQAIADSVRAALDVRFRQVSSGEILRAEDVREAVLAVNGISSVSIDNATNVLCGSSEVLRMGRVNVGWLNA